MRTVLRNFFTILFRFKAATFLNIVGLMVAFAAFILIMMQVRYDYNFNKNISGWEDIYRLEIDWGQGVGQAVLSRPLSETFFSSSPYIAGGTVTNSFWGETVMETERDGIRFTYKERYIPVTPGIRNVFDFEMVDGTSDVLEEPDVVLIPESIAKRMFGTTYAVGKQLFMGEMSWTVGGVYKDWPENNSLYNGVYRSMGTENADNWGNNNYYIYLRLITGTDPRMIEENFIMNFMQQVNEQPNMNFPPEASLRLTSYPELHFIKGVEYDTVEKSSRPTLIVLTGIAFVLLIIAAINYTNFSLAMSPLRVKSINTQKVMGAGDAMLRRGLLMEAFAICLLAYLLSLGLVVLFSYTPFAGLVSGGISLSQHTGICLAALGISAVIALCAGLYPAYYITSFSPALVLKGSFGLSPKGRSLRSGLLGFQFIASFALIIGASFMYLQNHFMQNESLGFEKDELIIIGLNNTLNKNQQAFLNEIRSFAGVKDITLAHALLGSGDRYMGWVRSYKDEGINFQCLPVTPSFMEVMGIPVTEGRGFREDDTQTANGVFIFNERAKSTYGLEVGEKIEGMEIIGFMPDVKFASLRREVDPMAFYVWGTQNWRQSPSFAYVQMKAGTKPKEAMDHIQGVVTGMDPGYPFDIRFFDEILQRTYDKERTMATLITLFSLIAILISIVGVFGLVIFESQYKLKEIGVRKVLGSTTEGIIIMFNRHYIRTLVLCFVIAAPIAYFMVKSWMENFAYRTPMLLVGISGSIPDRDAYYGCYGYVPELESRQYESCEYT